VSENANASSPDVSAVPDATELLRRQESLRGFVESISSELELRPLLTRILRHACELIGADNGSIGLVDARRNVVRTEAIYNMPPEERGSEMAPGVGLAGEVFRTGAPIVLDRYGDVAQPTQPTILENAVIGMPIAWHGRMVGFFGIGISAVGAQPGAKTRFTAEDVDTLGVFARHAAIAIENARRYAWEQQRTERLGLIARIGRIVTSDLRLEDLLQNAADAIHELLGYQNIAIALLEPGESGKAPVLVLGTVGGDYRSVVKGEHRLPITRGIMGAAASAREVVLVNDVTDDPRHVPTPGAEGITAELAVPILLGERVLGVLNVESGDPFDDEDAASLSIIADQLAVAIENARLFSDAQRFAALEERQRLARDLHDSVTQQIFSMHMIAQSLPGAWSRDRAEAERRTERLVDLARTALGEMRALLAELRPGEQAVTPGTVPSGIARLHRHGLPAALAAHVEDLARDEIAIDMDAREYSPQPSRCEETLYRIAQEALNNIVKHAHAHRVEIRLRADGPGARLTIHDDGIGIAISGGASAPNARGAETSGGMGLAMMRERAESVGGSVRVRRATVGTVVDAVIPAHGEPTG
jgi:signal transduction histidine kinase